MTRRRKRLASDPHLGLLELLHMAGGSTLLLFGAGFWMLGLKGAALVEASYVCFTIGTLLWLQVSPRSFRPVVWLHVIIVTLVPMGVNITLGGPMDSGGFGVWGLIGPLAAMMFLGRRATWIAGGVFVATLVVPALVPPGLTSAWITVPPLWVTRVLGVANIAGASILSLATLAWFVRRLRFEQERADALLLSVLPREIGRALRGARPHRGSQGAGVTMLVAEIVELSPMCAKLGALEVRDLLHSVFSHFDVLAARTRAEVVRTMDESYTVIFGLPEPYEGHARDAALLALAMRAAVASQRYAGQRVELRIAINSGPLGHGVAGRRRFIYDTWGRTLSLAARMGARAEPGCILVTQDSWELLREEFLCRESPVRTSRASGALRTWDLLDRREDD
jgi:adenylate cyclase